MSNSRFACPQTDVIRPPRETGHSLLVAVICAGLFFLGRNPAWAEEDEHGGSGHEEVVEIDQEGHENGHGAAHGGGHHIQHLDNWFSLSFGPDKEHQNAPFFWAIFNFVILVVLVLKFGSKPIREYLQTRHETIAQALQEATAINQQAHQKLNEIDAMIKNLDHDITEIKEGVVKDAELEKQRIIQNAEHEAKRIIEQAEKTLEKELRRAHRQLEVEAINAALEAAEKVIKQQINDKDRQRLNEEYFAQIGSTGGLN